MGATQQALPPMPPRPNVQQGGSSSSSASGNFQFPQGSARQPEGSARQADEQPPRRPRTRLTKKQT